ncbi:hypothetical protein PIB30_088237 [Stylosanthes scabra]|uniref:Protein kinase domain-containing protein n=1 Tax=Stylosanthes scabra TaxID=79078 RepID=A0ABU6SUZ8_9FABA|nr:hypothetical protein [Stylosanthes scabra]
MNLWNESTNHCTWFGITCNFSNNGRVISLILSDQQLTGTVPPSIGNLTFLTKLNLRNNSFHGEFPQQVGNLQHLQHVNISYNVFGGNIFGNLSQCKELSILAAGHNNFTGTIPSWVGNFSSSMSQINLAVNNFHGSIPNEVGYLSSLTLLALNGNHFSGTIPLSVFNISSLYFFTVSQNNLHGTLPFDVGTTLPNLEIFAGGVNSFTGKIPESLTNASRLQILDFAENGLIGTIPRKFSRLPLLERLNFEDNKLGSGKVGDLNFLDSLVNCTSLQVLGLAGNNFGGYLPSSISNLSTQLDTLTVGANKLHGSVPIGIGNLVNLTLLELEENSFSDHVPYTIGMLQNLETLALRVNNFSGPIPSSLGNLTRLTGLLMEENDFEGNIPSSLGNCKKLLMLTLHYNKLNGTIPREVLALYSLSISLDLSHNLLAGFVPMEVGNLANLGKLDLSYNRFSGMIPATLGSCLSLEFLHLQGNSFEGNIPSTFQSLRGLEDLDLSFNNLSGKIPQFLGMFQELHHLNLSCNDFEGEVPKNGIFKNVTSFSLDKNSKLCGGVTELNLSACAVKEHSSSGKFLAPKIVAPVAIALVFLLSLSCRVTIFVAKRVRKKSPATTTTNDLELRISYLEIARSTKGFSQENLIGTGSFGSVYKGVLPGDGTIVAVKVLNLEQRGASRSFINECQVLRATRHRNLLKIVTAVSSVDHQGNDFKALVFEFMPNGNLDDWLHPTINSVEYDQTKRLSFIQRLNIAIDVACALEYLHHFSETPIVHCDIKPSNVLLDNDMVAHVGDFGLATFMFEDSSYVSKQSIMSACLKGSIGYIPPEYGMGGHPSTQGDIYSYGILLLEIFTGKRPTDEIFVGGMGINQFTATAIPNHVMHITDPLLISEEEYEQGDEDEEDFTEEDAIRREHEPEILATMLDCLVLLLQIGVSCSANSPCERLPMNVVVNKLHAIKNIYLRTQ